MSILVIVIVVQHFTISNLKCTISAHKCTTTVAQRDTKVTTDSVLEVTPKKTASEPDLDLGTTYVAKIDNKVVKVPVNVTKVDTKESATGYTATVKQEVDVSALVKPLVPKWEVGTGLGVHKGDVYVPLSIQRNYKVDKGVEFELQFNDHGLAGGSVMHKWRF